MSTNSFSLNSSVHPAHKSPVLKVFSLHLLLLRNHSMLWLKSLVLWITDILPPILRHRSRTSKAPSVSDIGTRPNLFPLHTVSLETVSLFILTGCQPAVSQLTTFPFKSKLQRYFRLFLAPCRLSSQSEAEAEFYRLLPASVFTCKLGRGSAKFRNTAKNS